MTPAQVLTSQCRAAVSKVGARLFPMVVGKFWAGQVVKTLHDGSVVLKNPRIVNIGTKGMPDLVGWVPVVVTPDMVGQTVAIYVATEIKAGNDRLRPEQASFIDAVNKNGGRAGVARTAEDGVRIVIGEGSRNRT